MANLRKRIWIDSFQTRFIARMLFYCIAYQVALWVILSVVQSVVSAMESLTSSPPVVFIGSITLVSLAALLGLMTVDAIRYMHRLVGPIVRFRRTVQAIAAGEPVDLVQLRRDDFLQDLRADFNEMLKALEEKGAVVIVDRNAVEQVA